MPVIDSAYQYYLNTYGNLTASRYDAHKKGQLRAVYNNIIKTNKETPLYKIKSTGEEQKFAIDIKERARSIQNVVAALSDFGNDIDSVFSKKIAQSSDDSTVSAEYIGENQETIEPPNLEVEVKQLASPQINVGVYLSPDKSDIKPGTYHFDLATTLSSYEFQYNVNPKDNNRDVQEKLIQLINSSNAGLFAEVTENAEGKNAVTIQSKQTGRNDYESCLFKIMPASDPGSVKAMHTLGIDHIEKEASSSVFLLNGKEHTSPSNTFTIQNTFELTLKKVSKAGEKTQIGFKANTDAITDNIHSLVSVYNNIIQLGHDYSGTQHTERLLHDMSASAKNYGEKLENMGLSLTGNGCLTIDQKLLSNSVVGKDSEKYFLTLNDFKDDLNQKAYKASINPMLYVDKVVVAYKNPGRNFASPYISSAYSGMMLDHYC